MTNKLTQCKTCLEDTLEWLDKGSVHGIQLDRKSIMQSIESTLKTEEQGQRYKIMSMDFKQDTNGNPISRFKVFKIVPSDDGDIDIAIRISDRRSQCGYNDLRCEHALHWLRAYTGKSLKFLNSTGSRSEGLVTAIFEEEN